MKAVITLHSLAVRPSCRSRGTRPSSRRWCACRAPASLPVSVWGWGLSCQDSRVYGMVPCIGERGASRNVVLDSIIRRPITEIGCIKVKPFPDFEVDHDLGGINIKRHNASSVVGKMLSGAPIRGETRARKQYSRFDNSLCRFSRRPVVHPHATHAPNINPSDRFVNNFRKNIVSPQNGKLARLFPAALRARGEEV